MRFIVVVFLASWTATCAAASALDSEGRRLTLPAPAQRIVSLAPHATELLFAAGAGEKVIAVSEYSDFPEAARRLPRVSSSGNVDIEGVVALRPDLAVAWRLEATSRALDRLQSLGIPVFYSEPHRLEEIPGAIEALAALAGTERAGEPEATRLRDELSRLRAAYRDRLPVAVFYQITERPLMTLNGRHFVSDALSLCGATNVFAGAPLIAPVVSVEAVLAADPGAIIATRAHPDDASWQAAWRRFPALRAVRNDALLAIAGEDLHRHGPRAIRATGKLCALLDEARSRIKAAAIRR